MSVEYLGLADYVAVAAEVTSLDIEMVMKVTDLGLATRPTCSSGGVR